MATLNGRLRNGARLHVLPHGIFMKSIGDLIERRAQISPERIFWREGKNRWRYDELDAEANRVAGALRAEGLKPGEHAAIFAGNSFAYLCAHFGAAKAGVVLVHLNAGFTAAELGRLGHHCGARLLFFGGAQAERVARAEGDLPRVRRHVLLPGSESDSGIGREPRVEGEGGEAPFRPARWNDWLAPAQGAEPLPATDSFDPGAPFQLLYTSGTTGAPKGALISHRAKLRQGRTHALNLGLMPGDRVLSSLPLYHQFAQWLLLVSVPLAGATVVARPGFDPVSFWRALEEEEITHLPAVPTMLYRMLDVPEAERHDAARLRCIVYGGAPMDAARIAGLRAAFPRARLFQGFGQTETGYCLGLMDDDHERRPESLGRPDLFSDVRLLDREGNEVPPEEVGEIVARTPYLMNGYHQDPEANAAYFKYGADWGRTGDLAWRDREGFYMLAGRRDDLVISGGVNIYPDEVERVLQAHGTVAEVAVFGLPDPDWGQVLAAAIVPMEGASPSSGELNAHCRAALADFKCPKRYFLLPDLPKTSSGKVKKFELKEWIDQGRGEPL